MAQNNQQSTNTQIRDLYSEGISRLNTSFYNTNLSFKFYPFAGKDNTGKNSYDKEKCQNTTVNFEGAAALEIISKLIIDEKIDEVDLPIQCAGGASLNLVRRPAASGGMETVFSITKNGVTIPFVFRTIPVKIKVSGQYTTKILEVGLKSFHDIVDGYLTGINSDRHLDKLTEDYIKSLGINQNQPSGGANNNYNNNGNRNNYGGKKQYNNNYNNRKPYNNSSYNQNGWNNQQPQQQDMSSYQIGN